MAGLLDYLFDPSTYGQGGQQASLLNFLNSPLMQFPGSAPSAQPERLRVGPQQASPIAVGNYQMPRTGAASLYDQPASLPANAQPTQGQLPPAIANAKAQVPQQQDQLPASLNPSQPGFMNFYQSLKNGGGLIGSLYAGATGQRLDPRGIQQQQLQAQYVATRDALIANGVDPQKANSTAMLATLNPEAAKTVLPQLLTNQENFGVISEDPLTGKQYGFINPIKHTVQPIGASGTPGQSTGLQGLSDKLSAMRSQGATKEQLLAQIPSGYRDDVDSLISGKAVPANMGRAQSRMALLTLAKVVDPNFDETMIPTRIQMRKDFAGEGKNGQAIGAFNTVQHHAGLVSDAIERFQQAGGGGDYPILNAGKLMVANNTGLNPQLRDAAEHLKNELNATEHEVASAYNAGHITDADRKTWNEIKASNLPADQLRQKLADFVDLLNGKRESLNHMYRNVFGTDAPSIDKQANEEVTSRIHSRLPGASQGSVASAGGIPEGATATNPQTGQKIVRKNGAWVPLQ